MKYVHMAFGTPQAVVPHYEVNKLHSANQINLDYKTLYQVGVPIISLPGDHSLLLYKIRQLTTSHVAETASMRCSLNHLFLFLTVTLDASYIS